MHKKIKRRLSWQFSAIMVAFILIIILLAVLFMGYSQKIQANYKQQQNLLSEKVNLTQKLVNDVNQLVLDTRGYFAYGTPQFKTDLAKDQQMLDNEIQAFSQVAKTSEDQTTLDEMRDFYTQYVNGLLPKGLQYYEKQDIKGLSIFSEQENAVPYVKNVIAHLKMYQSLLNQQLNEQQLRYLHLNKLGNLYFLLFVFLVLVLVSLFSVILARRMGEPLNHLVQASLQLTMGETVNLQKLKTKREDELGLLSRSFHDMVISIKDNEQELLAQNEELVAQQDELQAQQDQLEDLISQMKVQEDALERRNTLNLSLSQSLDKSSVLTSIIDNLVKLLRADKGIVIDLLDDDYAEVGMSEGTVKRFLDYLDDGYPKRAIQSKQPQLHQRRADEGEQGIHDYIPTLFDLYVPVTSYRQGKEETIALIYLTRMDVNFTKEELIELKGFSRKIILTLDKLNLYAHNEYEKIMNQSILNTIREGVHFVDQCGVTTLVNEQWAEFVGQEVYELVGEPVTEWLPNLLNKVNDPKPLETFMNRILSNEPIETQEGIYRVDGETNQVIQVYFETLKMNGDFHGTIFVHRDITKEYELQRMKSELVNTVSHELRTPLSSVLGFSERLMTKDLSDERKRSYIQFIYKESQRLTRLVNDFLDIQRMDSGRVTYNLKETDVVELVKEAVEPFEMEHTHHQFVIKNELISNKLVTDHDRLRQVVTNLLSNAVKYSPRGGNITVHIKQHADDIQLSVKDEGLGIPEDALNKIFNIFYRVDNSDHRKIGGTGLGLSLSKELIQGLGGDLTVRSTIEQGSTFTISLPNEPGPSAAL